jgi:aspartate carbamoyltransferase catalytic subunit
VLPRLICLSQARGKYIIDANVMKQLRKDAVVLHPLPRVDEVRLVLSYNPIKSFQCLRSYLNSKIIWCV